MPRRSMFEDRADQVWKLYQEGLNPQEIAKKLGRWHWRTIQNDISRLKNTIVPEVPDWFNEAQLIAMESIDDLRNLRDEAWVMMNNTEKPPSTITKVQIMKLLADINGRLADKLLPSQAIIEQIGDKKIEISWAGDKKDLPLCTKCGQKHEGECALVGDSDPVLTA